MRNSINEFRTMLHKVTLDTELILLYNNKCQHFTLRNVNNLAFLMVHHIDTISYIYFVCSLRCSSYYEPLSTIACNMWCNARTFGMVHSHHQAACQSTVVVWSWIPKCVEFFFTCRALDVVKPIIRKNGTQYVDFYAKNLWLGCVKCHE